MLDSAMLGRPKYERREGERYYTEPWVTRALLAKVRFRGLIWEPCAGRGDIADVLSGAGYKVMASDIEGDRLGCKGAAETDFLTCGSPVDGVFSIVTNPPYDKAEGFLRKALELTARSSGMVAMLFRNEYDCAASRRDLFECEAFAAKLVLTKRPRWLDPDAVHVASPRHNFAWMLWDHNHSGPPNILYGP